MTVEAVFAYPRLLRTLPRYRWWKPLVAVLLLGALVLAATVVVALIALLAAIALGQVRVDTLGHLQQDVLAWQRLDASSPFALFVALASVAVMLPFGALAYLCLGLRPVGVLSSVALRLRWRWMLACLGPAAVAIVVPLAVQLGVGALSGQALSPVTTPPATLAVCLALVVLLVPVQAAAEEVVFRGVLVQALGSWIRWTPLPLVIPQALFVAAHTQYVSWGLVSVAMFGLTAAWLVWRTGGLEAGIALHTVNNVVSFALLSSGVLGTTVNDDAGGSWLDGLVTVVTMAGYALWIDRMARRRGLATRREIPTPREYPEPVPTSP